ncbi:hypothetical protein GGI17_003205 [Coemansia sp. S146]|nr:hypothetical protein GGI17_003205 [Coemansia sp. S146]
MPALRVSRTPSLLCQARRHLATVKAHEILEDKAAKTTNSDQWLKTVQGIDPFSKTQTRVYGSSSSSQVEEDSSPDNAISCPDHHSHELEHSIRDFLSTTRQRPRAGLKPDELVVKCPVCSPGKSRRLAYSAHLNTNTGAFVCTGCFEQGSWDKYQELAKRRNFQNTIPKSRANDPPPFEFAEATLMQLQTNLANHEEIYAALTGQEKGQLRLRPEMLAQYGVGLGFVNTAIPEILDLEALVKGCDHSVPCLVFPRTAFRTNSFIESSKDSGAALDPAQSVISTGRARGQGSAALSSMIEDASDSTGVAASLSDSASLSEFCTVQLKIVGWNIADLEMYVPVDEAQPGLFGFHVASAESPDIILTGHELDAVAAYQETGIPAVSLPRGPYQLPLDAMRALERYERVYVWLDDDHQGAAAAELITRKLGVDRCMVVHTKGGDPQGPKSASIALARGLDLTSILERSQPVQHDKVLDFSALREAVKFEVTNPDLIRGVESTDLPGWNASFKGLRPGELTILSGATGSGKTTVISQMSLDFCKSGVSTLWGSFEIPNVRLATRMMSQFAKCDVSKVPGDIDYWSRKFEQLPMYFLKFHGSTKPDTVLETMRHAVYAYDVKHIIIDNLQFMMSMQAKGMDKYDAQDAAIATFRQFATDEGVHITVVAHLRKDQPASDVDINSIFGSAKVTQEADNVVILQRYGNSDSKVRCLNVLKNRFDGTLGKIYISYNPETLGFTEIPAPRKRKSTKIIKSAVRLSMADRLVAEAEAGGSFEDIIDDQGNELTSVTGLSYAARRPLCALSRAGRVVGNSSSILAGVRAKNCVPQRAELVSGMPKALVFQSMGLSTVRSAQGLIHRADPASGGEAKEKAEISATPSIKVEPKKTLMEKIKHEAVHYWHGTKLFAKEVKLSSKLVSKVVWGGKLTRREQRQLRRTFTDTVRLVPFLLFVVIPFAELLLPVALKLFPDMLPSTYEDKATAEKKREKMQKVRNEMSRYLKETIAEMSRQRSEAKEGSGAAQPASGELAGDSVEGTSEFLDKIRSSSAKVSTSDLVRVAHIFEDELTLDNLSRPQLVSICRFMGVNAFGTDNYLRYQITNRMRYIRADDKVICGEGIDSLSVPELQSACQSRGIRIIGVSPARMREELNQWIELHLEHNIPSTLLILSRILAAGEPMAQLQQQQQFNADALQATINSLPDNLVNEATLRLAEVSGKATPKQKLEVLEEQEELIEDEDEQEKKRQSREAAESKGKAEEGKDSDAASPKN